MSRTIQWPSSVAEGGFQRGALQGFRGLGSSDVSFKVHQVIHQVMYQDDVSFKVGISNPEGGNGNPLQYSCLENPMDRGAWWATVHRVTESDKTEHMMDGIKVGK